MFTWICPTCGREVPPSYTECPDCAAKAAKGGTAPPPETPAANTPAAPPPQQSQPPHAPPQPPQQLQQPSYQPPPYQQPQYAPPAAPRRPAARAGGMPTWLMTIVFALAFLGLGAGIYWTIGYFKSRNLAPTATVENPAAKPGTKSNPLQKYIEVAGIRFAQDPKKKSTVVKFVLTNHSEADINGLAGNVTIWGRTQKSEEDAQGTFSFTTNLGPFESKEMTAFLTTKLKIYELPDWQNITADVQITAPAALTGYLAPRPNKL
jgi:hypothetical protein